MSQDVAEAASRPVEYNQHIFRLADAVIVSACATPHTAKIRPQGRITKIAQRFCQGLHDLILCGTAKQRMWMAYQRNASW